MDGFRSTRRRPVTNALLLFALFCAIPLPLFAQDSSLEDNTSELANLNLGDASVSLRIAGRWKGTLQAGLGIGLTEFGASALSSNEPFFTQEGDLTLSLWMMNRWFIEGSFIDDSSLNTYRAGYQGLEGEAVRYVGVGNTGLDFPAFPYLDLGGDSPSSFGAYGHFQAGNVSLHSLVRYDAAAREEKVFVGNRERSFSYMDLSRPQRGVLFILPDDNLDSMPLVYIQDNKGDLAGSDGKMWRLAELSEYWVDTRTGRLGLTLGTYTGGATEPEGKIAVNYTKNGIQDPWLSSMGNYSASPGFLFDVQEYFDDTASPTLRLWDYPQPGQSAIALGDPTNSPAILGIDGKAALVIYEPGTFSPFEKQNRYQAPVSTSTQASLVYLSTGNIYTGYDVIQADDSSLSAFIQNQDQLYTQRGVYELIKDGRNDGRSPVERWPLIEYPELYLPGLIAFTEDIGLRFTNYSSSGDFYIGTDVVPGSVQVYRNGIQDPNFVYNPSSGSISLSNPAGFSEVIHITYLKQSSERRLGSLAAGIGAVWTPDDHFTGKLALGLRWNVTSEDYSESSASSPGTVGLSAEAKWDYSSFKAGLSLGLGFEQPDATGLYRIEGMNGNYIYLSLPASTSFVSEIPSSSTLTSLFTGLPSQLIYRNYQNSSVLTGTSLGDISTSAEMSDSKSGPYNATDREFSSAQVLVAEFNELAAGSSSWTGFQVPLGLDGEFLERAGRIEIPYRFKDFPGSFTTNGAPDDFKVIVQFGALADENFGNTDNTNLMLEKQIYPVENENSNPEDFNEAARIATIYLNDSDRIKLQGAKYMRLIVSGTSQSTISGKVILAPPVFWGALWRPVSVQGSEIINSVQNPGLNPVNAYELMDRDLIEKYPVVKRLNRDRIYQEVLEISWDNFSSSTTGPGVDGRVSTIPLSNYRSLTFFVRRPKALEYDERYDDEYDTSSYQYMLNQGKLRFVIARGPNSLSHQNEISMEAEIPLTALRDSGAAPGEWVKVDIIYQGADTKVQVDGRAVSGATVKPYRGGSTYSSGLSDQGETSSYAAIFIVPDGASIPAGTMAIDEIILEDALPSYRLNNGASVEWSRSGTILAIGGRDLVSDAVFQAAVETGAYGNPFEEGIDRGFGMNGRTQAGVSLLGARLSGNYSYSLSTAQGGFTDYSWSAGHSLFRAFGPLSISESFNDAPSDKTMNHRLSLALNTTVRGNMSGEIIQEEERKQRNWRASTGGKPAQSLPLDFSLDAQAAITERFEDSSNELSNYGLDWVSSLGDMLPDAGLEAEKRNFQGNFRIRLGTVPFGTELSFQGTSAFSRPYDTTQAGSLLRLDFPIKAEGSQFQFLFRTEREYKRSIYGIGGTFLQDGESWAASFNDALPLMFSIPFYSLFNAGMQDNMNTFSTGGTSGGSYAESSQFADRFDFSMTRGMNYGISSLYFPYRLSFRVGRILEEKLDTPRDTLSFSTVLGFSSINLFGAMGVSPTFSFYQGDEFSHSLEAQVSIPREEKVSWSARANQHLAFFGFSGSELGINNTFTINSSSRVGEGIRVVNNLTAAWTVPMERTLLGTIYGYLIALADEQDSWLTMAKLGKAEYELLRRETLELIFERVPNVSEGDYYRLSVTLGHESIVRIFGRLNLSVFAKLLVSEDTNSHVLSFTGLVGTTLTLMF